MHGEGHEAANPCALDGPARSRVGSGGLEARPLALAPAQETALSRAHDGREALALAQRTDPDVILTDIARRLNLSEGTVRNYLSESIAKLGVSNRIEAARLARQRGWL